MDVKRTRSPREIPARFREAEEAEENKKKAGWRWQLRRPEVVLIGFLASLPLLVFLFGGRWGGLTSAPSRLADPVSERGINNVSTASTTIIQDRQNVSTASTTIIPDRQNVSTPSTTIIQDRLLGGLLSPNFNEQSCLSRYKSSLYRKDSPFPPSPYLIKKLRRYEKYHKKCGPRSQNYKTAIEQLNSGRNYENSECKYVVWFPCNGLGNRMLTLASTFLYALLTNRVLLAFTAKESENLFCEPFPGSSWVLPPDFPFNKPYNLHIDAPESYVNMLNNGIIPKNVNISAGSLPAYVYLHAEQVRLRIQNNVFCEDDQLILHKFNWMILKSDSYFVPALFLMPSFQEELRQMFPVKESVFHHLGRYLFHPTNEVWGIIRRYYEAYLAKADEKVGLQIRIFPEKPIKFDNMYDQVLRCSRQEKLLPETGYTESVNTSTNENNVKAILITSLYAGYYERIRAIYYENPTVTGEIVAVYQPSHEEQQKTEAQNHNQKALAEIYLLSYCDKIAISAWSTFGYVAHGFAGLRPWILLRPPWNKEVSDVACVRAGSVEPCLHSPPLLECRGKDTDPANLVPHVRHCEDVDFGIKLFS